VKEKSKLLEAAREMRRIIQTAERCIRKKPVEVRSRADWVKIEINPFRFANVIWLPGIHMDVLFWHKADGGSRQQGWYHGPHPVPWRGGVFIY